MAEFKGKHSDITDKILAAFRRVYARLGYGFSEKVYQNAMLIELLKTDLKIESEKRLLVFYEGAIVGEYIADFVVADVVLVELKAVRELTDEHTAQTLNYLKATEIEVALLLNFGPHPEIKRYVYDNEKKGDLSWLRRVPK